MSANANQSVVDTLVVCGAGIVSGKEIMVLELSGGLRKRGHCVHIVNSFWNNGDFPRRLEELEIPMHILPLGFISATLTKRCLEMTFEQLRLWPRLALGYARLLRVLQPQKVVHTNWQHLLLLLPFLRPERDLFWLHEVIPASLQYRRLFKQLESRIEAFVCVSQATAASLRTIGISEDKVRVVHNGLMDPSGVDCLIEESCEPFRVGIVGQVNCWKGHEDLIQAFARLTSEHPSAELHIFGSGNPEYKKVLLQKSLELRVEARVKWHDFVSNRRLIYSSFDVCVVPSRSQDPLPTAAIEAGFFGLPSVVSRRGGLPEIVEHEVNGLLVEAEKPAELADALLRLIKEPSLRQRLGANARRRAVAYFGQERFLNEFLAVLNPSHTNVARA